MCARICVSGGRRSHVRRVASRYPGCGRSIEEVESSDHGQFMPLLFAIDLRYDLPRSRAAVGGRGELKRKNIVKAPRRASSRVVNRGDIQRRAGEPAGTKLDRIELSRLLVELLLLSPGRPRFDSGRPLATSMCLRFDRKRLVKRHVPQLC